ncbi:transcriptional repressor [Magnetospirillum aberrantis]|uniref:Ferric uptake regulation protein n=1 Tax=Magnetospirillum aberrantis SpK TaxID=908842 RepID=A0A7C9QRN4_9PROT|nr:transcriptional repressor [Magnetospirillum aberrantis SpK]
MPESLSVELQASGIRPTRQRVLLLGLIRQGGARHLSAEQLYREVGQQGLRLSLATVYNALNLFSGAGLLRRVDVGERTWFCSNPDDHHHMFDEATSELTDIPASSLRLEGTPDLPDGTEHVRTDVIVRVRKFKL